MSLFFDLHCGHQGLDRFSGCLQITNIYEYTNSVDTLMIAGFYEIFKY